MNRVPEIEPQKSVRVFPSLIRDRAVQNSNAHMFWEDIRTEISPFRPRPEFKFEFLGSEKDVGIGRSLISLFSSRAFRTDTESVCEALRQIVSDMGYEGSANYEILKERGTHRPIRLLSFSRQRLISTPFGCIQVVPQADVLNVGKRITFIPKSYVWTIEMPKALGGARVFRKIISTLGRFEYIGPKFWMRQLRNPELGSYFSHSEYGDRYWNFQIQTTRIWRWNFRTQFENNATEFYSLLRGVEFRISIAILREHLVQEINGLFKHLGLQCQLMMTGAPTPDDLRRARRDFISNAMPFHEVYDRTTINSPR
jgi:hypothetical protein